MVYHLYIANKNYSSWSLRPWLLMKVLKIPFVEHMEPLVPGSMRQPHWKAFSPTAHVPCLHDITSPSPSSSDSPPPIILWESLSIVEHLADHHHFTLPIYPSLTEYPHARAWARSAVAEMHAGFAALRDEMSMNIGLRVALPTASVSAALAKDLVRLDALWSEGLARFGGPFLAGAQFGAVDAFYAPVVLRLQTFVGSMDFINGEKARAYVEMVLGMEEVREWVDGAVREVWREPVHDEGTLVGPDGARREVLQDLRAVAE